jgi:uncharacterized membrane protein YkvA (DUF1232 family)
MVYQLLSMTGIPRLVFRLMMDRRVPLVTKLIPPAGIVYLILPYDLLPDILPALGRIDDLIVIVLSIALFLVAAPRAVVAELIRGNRSGPDDGPSTNGGSRDRGNVIDGDYRYLDDDKKPRR